MSAVGRPNLHFEGKQEGCRVYPATALGPLCQTPQSVEMLAAWEVQKLQLIPHPGDGTDRSVGHDRLQLL